MTTTLGDFTATAIDGDDVDLSSYDGQVVLIVNTASHRRVLARFGPKREPADIEPDVEPDVEKALASEG